MSSNWLTREGFSYLPAVQFLKQPEQVRDTMGVYMIFIAGLCDLLARVGLPISGDLATWTIGLHVHAYTGESVAIRSRVLLHLRGTVRDSGVRESLLSFQFSHGALWRSDSNRRTRLEERLNQWLAERAMVAFQPCSYIRDVERSLIGRMPSPLNTSSNTDRAMRHALTASRKRFRDHLRATGQYPHRRNNAPSAWLVEGTANHLAGEPMNPTRPLL